MNKQSGYVLGTVFFFLVALMPFSSHADDIQTLRSEHAKMSEEHKQMKEEHKEILSILKKVEAHITTHEKEMKAHEKEIKLHGKKLQATTASTPEIEAEHKSFLEKHNSEKTEHQTILSSMKQFEATLSK